MAELTRPQTDIEWQATMALQALTYRAEAAEAEVARLREALETADRELKRHHYLEAHRAVKAALSVEEGD